MSLFRQNSWDIGRVLELGQVCQSATGEVAVQKKSGAQAELERTKVC